MASAFISSGASYLVGKWRAEFLLREAIHWRKEIRSLPDWQPLMMELHIKGYSWKEVAGELNLPKAYVLRELARAYSTLRMRERNAQGEYPRKLRFKSRMMHELARVIA